MKIITRQEARAARLTRYYTGLPCKYGHVAQRFAGSSACVVCVRAYRKQFLLDKKAGKRIVSPRPTPINIEGIVSRLEAKSLGLTRYFTGISCKHGHLSERLVSNSTCIECGNGRVRQWAAAQTKEARSNRFRHSYAKRRACPQKYLQSILRVRVKNALLYQIKHPQAKMKNTGSAVRDLGCTLPEFVLYISQKFQPGMDWNNYGSWHLDHIKPLSLFNLLNRDEFLVACHYTNYQPLWARDNIRKSNKVKLEAAAT